MSTDSAGSVAMPRAGVAGDMRQHVRALMDGAIAGAFATWVMGKATSYMYEHDWMMIVE